ncbi:hypothetical protein HNV12_04225 [Methanococcoides sp. SA1]|nr:hypothetical protein [Methanococcoides sp. SA1]
MAEIYRRLNQKDVPVFTLQEAKNCKQYSNGLCTLGDECTVYTKAQTSKKSPFMSHLEKTTAEVATWPKWKRECMGTVNKKFA